MRAAGKSWRGIAKELGVSFSTIREACLERGVESKAESNGKVDENIATA
jgi:predicted HicB family RNase H-like nuclease